MQNQTSSSINILLVEDNPGDVFLIKKMLSHSSIPHTLYYADDGEAALNFLRQSSSPPPLGLVLLDLNLPKVDGHQVLATIKADPVLKLIPVIVLTSSNAPQDILTSYELYANCYITKPSGQQAYGEIVQLIEDFWLKCVQLPCQVAL